MAQITMAGSGAELEPWQEFDPGPEPGERGVDQAGRTYIWHARTGGNPNPNPKWRPGDDHLAASLRRAPSPGG
jgi:hypothetical protein